MNSCKAVENVMEKLVRGPVVRRVMRKAFGKEAEVIGRKSNDSMKCDISGSNVTYFLD